MEGRLFRFSQNTSASSPKGEPERSYQRTRLFELPIDQSLTSLIYSQIVILN